MADDKRFLGANDIAEILGCSASYAYNVIRQLSPNTGYYYFFAYHDYFLAIFFGIHLISHGYFFYTADRILFLLLKLPLSFIHHLFSLLALFYNNHKKICPILRTKIGEQDISKLPLYL